MENTLKKKSFFRTMMEIALPVSLQALIANSLGMIDQVMIGQLGEVSVAAVSLACKPFFILSFALGGLCAVSSIYSSQAEGAGDDSRHSVITKTALKFSFMCLLPFFVLSFFFPSLAIRTFTSDSSVIAESASYLRIVAASYVPQMIVMVSSSILRSTGKAKIPLVTGFISVGTNTLLNAVLIFGLFGLEPMNVRGAAVATLISRFMEMAILLAYMELKKHPACLSRAFGSRVSADFTKGFILTSLPAVGNEILWAVGNSIYTGIYGRLGTDALAAMTLTEPVQSLSIGFFSGLSAAAAIVIGNKLGAKEMEDAYRSSWKFLWYCVAGCAVVGLGIALGAGAFVQVYKVSPEIKVHTVRLLWIFAAFFVVKVCNMVAAGGIIRSGGETKFTLFLDVLGTYGIGLPLGLLGAFVFRLPLEAVYALLTFEEVVRLVLGLLRIKGRKWMAVIE